MKKISTAMVEAGVNAMARIQRTKQGDAAIVATIYNAMEAVHQNETRAAAGRREPVKPYVHQDWPQWFCRGEERRIFNSQEEVEEGWTPAVGAVAMSLAGPIKRGPGRPKNPAP